MNHLVIYIFTFILIFTSCSPGKPDSGGTEGEGESQQDQVEDGKEPDGDYSPPNGEEDNSSTSEGGPVTDADSGSDKIIISINFDKSEVGSYTVSSLSADWNGPKWSNGIEEGRVTIIDGDEAYSGKSLRVFYPAYKYGTGTDGSGAQWILKLKESHNELYCSYRIKFGSNFEFVKGGKLPGLIGGEGNTGFNRPDGTDGWSARMMWRSNGKAVSYLYYPDQINDWGDDFKWIINGQDYFFKPMTWHQVEHRIVMNTPGKNDGILQGWIDGVLALDQRNIRFRNVDTLSIDAFYFSTFFGGGDSTWAAKKDEHIFFDDFIISREPITH